MPVSSQELCGHHQGSDREEPAMSDCRHDFKERENSLSEWCSKCGAARWKGDEPSQPSTASGEQEAREFNERELKIKWTNPISPEEIYQFAAAYHSFRLSAEAEKKAEKIAQRFLCTKEFSDYKNIVVAIKQILEAEHDIP
jgi:hypothetical protein